MKAHLLTFAVALGLFAAPFARAGESEKPSEPNENSGQKSEKPLPTVRNNKLNFNFPDLDGKPVSLADPKFKDKVVIVTLWGTWCGECKKEIPTLKSLYAKYQKQGLEIVALAYEVPSDTALERLQKFVETNELKYTVLMAGSRYLMKQTLPDVSGINGTPTSFFIGRDGLVKKVDQGFFPIVTPNRMEAEIQELLAAPKSDGG